MALLLGLFSFYWQQRHPEFPWDGPLLLLAAAALLMVALRPAGRTATAPPRPTPSAPATGARDRPSFGVRHVPRWRLAAFVLSLALVVGLLQRLVDSGRPDYTAEVLLWFAAIFSYGVSVAPPVRRPREDWGLWWEVNRDRVLVLLLIVLGAALLRLFRLGEIPMVLGGDEGSQGLEAVKVIRGQIRNPFTTGWQGMPAISFYYNSLGIRLLGQTIAGVRLPWAIAGIASVLTTFWLVTRLRGLTLGLMTATLLAGYAYSIHFARLGANNIADPLFAGGALLFLIRARDRNSPLDWMLAGVTAAAAQYFYPGARLIPLLLAACLAFFFWSDRLRRTRWTDLTGGALILGGGYLVTAAPILQYAVRFPDDYNARLNQVGILQSGWLANEVAQRGSVVVVLAEQFARAMLSYNLFPDRTVWFGSPEPLMSGLWAVLFGLGFLYAIFRLLTGGDERLFPMVAWWLGAILLGGMLTESPPSTARLVVSAPPACFFVALALFRGAQAIQGAFGARDERVLIPVLTVGVLLLAGQSTLWYFTTYPTVSDYGSRNGQIATTLAGYLNENLEPERPWLFLGPPFLYSGFATLPYLAPAAPGIDVLETLTAPSDLDALVTGDAPPLFVAIPLREAELLWVEQAFPGGRREVVTDDQGVPLFLVYDP